MTAFHIGTQPVLEDATLFLDTGSSRFKGDSMYIDPILDSFAAITSRDGNSVFKKITDARGKRLGLEYGAGSPIDYRDVLPTVSLQVGESCDGDRDKQAVITLDPDQYAYRVEVGDRSGAWVLAFHVLDGVPGLLVGSTLMDLIYTEFNYVAAGDRLSQGDMVLFKKSMGPQPHVFGCVAKDADDPVSAVSADK